MRTKRLLALLLAALMALTLTACGAALKKDKKASMTVAPAQLSEEETALAELLALGMDSYRIFDFQAKGAKSLEFNVYELADGEWSRLSGGSGIELSQEEGRVALTFGKMTDGVELAVQAGGAKYSRSVQIESKGNVSNMTFVTSVLDNAAAIELEQEIPLTLQFATSKSEFSTYSVNYFGMPRELDKQGYEHVYAITVTFSAQELDGGSGSASAEPSPAN